LLKRVTATLIIYKRNWMVIIVHWCRTIQQFK
jgi:hypothetical protein